MSADMQRDVTTLLNQMRGGEPGARDRLVALVYDELRRLAGGLLRRERSGHTLEPTALVHEAVARLLRPDALADAQTRGQFFGVAARAMRQVLVDHARGRAAGKRSASGARLPLDEVVDHFARQRLDLLALHDALDRLSALHQRQGQVVELRFFGGYTMEDIANLLGVSLSTAESDFRKATAFLRRLLSQRDEP